MADNIYDYILTNRRVEGLSTLPPSTRFPTQTSANYQSKYPILESGTSRPSTKPLRSLYGNVVLVAS
ncbi:hypothetical protein CCACVL1_08036 [Corchorus capsularis]|uniref:Uncharacterized protein n=1 Tax=Corchorus capsularis TaxID=210143 RepID=A0A1R3J2J4_COCAP|nr:hypothetical protein CCACVL1_08036 [Corchorus capsularis]